MDSRGITYGPWTASRHGMVFDEGQARRPAYEIVGTWEDLLRDEHNQPVRWLYKSQRAQWGLSAFLVGRGWSVQRYPQRLKQIADAGIFTMAVNNTPRDIDWKPNAWTSGDPSKYFARRIWTDPDIMKFAPIDWANCEVHPPDADESSIKVKDAQPVWFFERRCNVFEGEWFEAPFINWGTCQTDGTDSRHSNGGVRCSMLCAFRLLFHLGFRNIYMIGCDFAGHPSEHYYRDVCDILTRLKPQFDALNVRVIQCNPLSNLQVWDWLPFDEGLADASAHRHDIAASPAPAA